MMEGPIFIIGRQYSGNTMLARCLGRAPEVYSVTGEGVFFEHQAFLDDDLSSETIDSVLSLVLRSGGDIPDASRAELREQMREAGEEGNGRRMAGRMYARCMEWLARQKGATRWAQKATSYIFYVDAILECFPDARLVFLVRNPLDLAASMKRRGQWKAVARMVHGWNKGVRLALRYADARADRLLVVQYEQFVEKSYQKMKDICEFCDLPFRERYLKIPHVNRSESAYNQTSRTKGISSSRLGYYQQVLSDTEAGAIRTLVDHRAAGALYPDHFRERRMSLGATSYAIGLASCGVGYVMKDHARKVLKNPHHTIQRIKKRLLA